jgi:hypothetical protein
MVQVLGLVNTIDYRQVVQTTDAYADRVTNADNFKLLLSAVPARIQPATASTLDLLGKRGLLNHYECYILPDVNCTYGDLVIDTANGNAQYKVVSWKDKADLACALTLLLEKVF